MSQQPKYVAYLSDSDSGSAQFREYYGRLPPTLKPLVKILDYNEIKATYGASCPKWLRGFPTMATYETTPTVWEGSKAVELMGRWASEAASASKPAAPRALQGASSGIATAPRNPAEQEMVTLPQNTDGEYGRGSCVVSDDLYDSRMPNKGGAAGGKGKVTQSDLARYTNARDELKPRTK